ncbi:uncharacterized protein PHACADRAFT_203777 [Phanerochaete carnosa HHB-10118-sp]|uniref:Uncharacterized protein n=1 Tax=Phanerochaete carnosa (strain HHB-10118-sp) TaxID=650164 RepID=K5WN07_PHACS|nr:uncharacterized protein PHACADRAFT_203777 [Phanerochaete carnosa HHB-10118-sp]EKM60604.1 hypothetical protein PHACADRAFT_203777 [Phanerochaete carnosa HHB-10118-sp]
MSTHAPTVLTSIPLSPAAALSVPAPVAVAVEEVEPVVATAVANLVTDEEKAPESTTTALAIIELSTQDLVDSVYGTLPIPTIISESLDIAVRWELY